jgi:hypothetical protein
VSRRRTGSGNGGAFTRPIFLFSHDTKVRFRAGQWLLLTMVSLLYPDEQSVCQLAAARSGQGLERGSRLRTLLRADANNTALSTTRIAAGQTPNTVSANEAAPKPMASTKSTMGHASTLAPSELRVSVVARCCSGVVM